MRNILKRLSVAFLAVATTSVVCEVQAGYPQSKAYVLNLDPEIKPALQPGFNASRQNIQNALKQMDLQTKQSLDTQGAAITNAINILTTQKAMSASQLGHAIENNTHVQLAAEQAMDKSQKAKEAIEQYGAKGAGHAICQSIVKRSNIVITEGNTRKAVPNMIASEVTARPGRYSSRSTALAERLALHDKLYCTDSQAASGLCHGEAERAGVDLKAATLFKPAPFDSDAYRDKSAFINNMMGLPDDPIPASIAATQQGQAYLDLKRRKDAIKSTALVSLKNIQAEWSSVASEHHEDKGGTVANSESKQLASSSQPNPNNAKDGVNTNEHGSLNGGGQSLALQMKSDVDQYLGGGKSYQEWSKTLVGANERGILKEILQVKALRLYIQSQQYKQLARMESMLAANVAAETYRSGMEANVEKQRQDIMRKATTNMVLSATK